MSEISAIMTAHRTISNQISIDSLIESLLTIAIRQVGAERALLLFTGASGDEPKAEATADGTHSPVTLKPAPIASVEYPKSVVRYVIRMEETVVLDNASGDHQFSDDEYIKQKRPRSVVCLPLIAHREVVGILDLENLSERSFTRDKIATLELLGLLSAASLKGMFQQRPKVEG